MRRAGIGLLVLIGLACVAPQLAEASLLGGIGKVVRGVFQLPLSTLAGTIGGPPLVGTAFGLVNGAFQGLSMVTRGTFEIVASAVPLAKAAAPFVLPFLL